MGCWDSSGHIYTVFLLRLGPPQDKPCPPSALPTREPGSWFRCLLPAVWEGLRWVLSCVPGTHASIASEHASLQEQGLLCPEENCMLRVCGNKSRLFSPTGQLCRVGWAMPAMGLSKPLASSSCSRPLATARAVNGGRRG